MRGGDLFRGRHAALAVISQWLSSAEPSEFPLVVTGQPGAGKSVVLARAVTGLDVQHHSRGLAFYARAATIGDFLAAIAALTGTDTTTSVDELIDVISALPSDFTFRVAVDALDEAASELDRRQIAAVLMSLASLPRLRVVVATRAVTSGNRFRIGTLFSALGVTGPDSPNLIDLDTDAFFEPMGLLEFAAAVLAQDETDRPGPSGAAWERYRADRSLCRRVAAVIAGRARRNYLVAAMAAVPLSATGNVVDPASKEFDLTSIPSSVGEALDKYLDQLTVDRRASERGLLTALAYGRGTGLDDNRWLTFATVLGYAANGKDLDILRYSQAADYLLQTSVAGSGLVTSLFHQALIDELLTGRSRANDESRLLDSMFDEASRVGWSDAYLRNSLAEHAAACGRIDEILANFKYLIYAAPGRLVPHLDTAQSITARITSATYRQAAHMLTDADHVERASIVELYACYLGYNDLAMQLGTSIPDRTWKTTWSHGRRDTDHQTLSWHKGRVLAVTAASLLDRTRIIISGGEDRTAQVWQPAGGDPLVSLVTGHKGRVTAVAADTLPDGTPVIITGSGDRAVRILRLADGVAIGEPITGHSGVINALTPATLPDGTPIIITASEDRTVRLWRLEDHRSLGSPLTGHTAPVTSVATSCLPDGTPVIISGSLDRTVRVWRLTDRTPVGGPLTGHAGWVLSVAASFLADGTPVIISGSFDQTVRVWRLTDHSLIGDPLTGHTMAVTSVAASALHDDTPVIISGSEDKAVRVWRLADHSLIGDPLTGHTGKVTAVTATVLDDDTPVVVSGSEDGTVRLWRLASAPLGHPLAGHTQRVIASVVSTLPDGTPVVVSSSFDETVRFWRLADGKPAREPIITNSTATALARGSLPDGTPIIIVGTDNGSLRLWRMSDGSLVAVLFRGHAAAVTAVAATFLPDGTPVIVSSSRDHSARVWRLSDGAELGPPIKHEGQVATIAVSSLPDGTPVVISSSEDRTLRFWRLADHVQLGDPIATGPPLGASAVAAGILPGGTPVIVGGHSDGTLRMWRITDHAPHAHLISGHVGSITALAVDVLPDGTPVIISGGSDGTVRIWRLSDGVLLRRPLRLADPLESISVYGDLIVTGSAATISLHRLRT
jgi:WD40 repeat protein